MMNLNKYQTKSMKLSKYISIQKNEYSIVQLIPIKANRNTSTEQIAMLVNKMYQNTEKILKTENRRLVIKHQYKLSFYIHITKKDIQFYFIIPKVFIGEYKVKFRELWRNIEIKEVYQLPININDCTKYQLKYKYDDCLSCNIDKRSNELLNANFTIVSELNEKEEAGIFYNFIPVSEKQSNYIINKNRYKLDKYKAGDNLKKTKDVKDYLIIFLKSTIDIIDQLLSLLAAPKKQNNIILNRDISSSTKRKNSSRICKTQALLLSSSSNKDREKDIINNLANTYKVINDDNELIVKEVNKSIDIKRPILNNITINNTSIEECNNFLNMPSMDIIKNFNMINHNKILEKTAPKTLTCGSIRIGTVKYKENKEEVYYSMDKEIKRLGRVICGPMGAGKDYYMTNIAKDIIKENQRGLIVIDYIDECQLAEGIKKVTPPERIIEIDCSDTNTLQALSYNEYKYNDNDSEAEKVDICMQKAQQYNLLLDTINDINSNLTARMLKYFDSSATICNRVNINCSLRDIIEVLKNPVQRSQMINKLSKESQEMLKDEIDDLRELDKVNKNGDIENYDSKIEGILDRTTKLRGTSIYTKLSYNKTSEGNVDFIKAINDKKIILIKIPGKKFSKSIRSMFALYFLQKVWIAKEQGATKVQTELFINEIHHSFHCQLLLQSILVECRKYNLTPTLSLHYLGQLNKNCKESILANGTSFILIQGCDINAFQELEIYFNKYGYTKDDLAQLERYQALCLIKNEEENYSAFVAKLPD